jgi:hypothetical protein
MYACLACRKCVYMRACACVTGARWRGRAAVRGERAGACGGLLKDTGREVSALLGREGPWLLLMHGAGSVWLMLAVEVLWSGGVSWCCNV